MDQQRNTQTLNMPKSQNRYCLINYARISITHSYSETARGSDYWGPDYYSSTYDSAKDCAFEAKIIALDDLPGESQCSRITTVSVLLLKILVNFCKRLMECQKQRHSLNVNWNLEIRSVNMFQCANKCKIVA